MKADPGERFWAKVDRTGDCWLWTGATHSGGYGNFWDGLRYTGAHRFAYEMLAGPIPGGLHLDHLCRVRSCVNPAHLEPVPVAENIRRGSAARTHCKNGHELTEANTRVSSGHRRECRACDRERRRLRVGYQGSPPNKTKTHCKRGHEFTPENTRIGPRGARICRTCQMLFMRQKRAAAA